MDYSVKLVESEIISTKIFDIGSYETKFGEKSEIKPNTIRSQRKIKKPNKMLFILVNYLTMVILTLNILNLL